MKKVIYSVISACVAELALVFGIILLVHALTPQISVKLESDYDEEALEMHVAVSVRSECGYDIKKSKIYLGYYSKQYGDIVRCGAIYVKSNETVHAILTNYDINNRNVSTDICYEIDYIEVDNAGDIAVAIVCMAMGCAATVIAMLLILSFEKDKKRKAEEEEMWWVK